MIDGKESPELETLRERSRRRYMDQSRTPLLVRLILAQDSDDVIEAISESGARVVEFAIDYRFPIALYMAWRMRKRYKRKIKAAKR